MRPPETPVVTIRLVEEWGKRPVGTVLEVDATRADWLIERGYAQRDSLMTFSLPAGSLKVGDAVRVTAKTRSK